jgi:20S proteasome alpha/beta subunit
MVTERRIQSKLMEPKADAEKLKEIDTHIGCTSSGIIADARYTMFTFFLHVLITMQCPL